MAHLLPRDFEDHGSPPLDEVAAMFGVLALVERVRRVEILHHERVLHLRPQVEERGGALARRHGHGKGRGLSWLRQGETFEGGRMGWCSRGTYLFPDES